MRERTHSSANGAGETVSGAAQHALEALNDGVARAKQAGTQLRTQASQVGASTVEYIQCEPVKAVLIAAAAGATLTVLTSALLRARR
ncbi:MAG: hypothetical protein HY021_15230 [Burkholderiales bacterium]|nr:hypothetical protein [Burkholderiales bacterium]